MDDRPKCKTCVYWEQRGQFVDWEGWCKRHAPQPKFAETHYTQWCGEHPDFPAWLEAQRKDAK